MAIQLYGDTSPSGRLDLVKSFDRTWLRGAQVVAGGRLLPEQPGGIFLPRKLS